MPNLTSYCASLVRAHDHDRYLCALFAPANVREAWLALFAFNHEIAIISETVSEEMLGHIRLAWWREALDEIYMRVPVRRHPVAEALERAIHTYALPREPFDRLLEARARDLSPEPFASMAELEAYCRDTSSTLLHLCSAAACIPASGALDGLGVAWALTGMARAQKHRALTDILAAAEKHLEGVHKPPFPFTVFYHASRFYLARLKTRKSIASPWIRLRLMCFLWWKS